MNFDPTWTADEAWNATLVEVQECGKDYSDPTLPISRWGAFHRLELERKSYESGDSNALFGAIRICACHAMPMPPWVSKAFIRGYDLVLNGHLDGWDKAFGNYHKKGTKYSAYRRNKLNQWAVVRLASQIREARPEISVDDLFLMIGADLNISASKARDLYYQMKASMPWLSAFQESS